MTEVDPGETGVGRIKQLDAASLRALAHPLRVRLLGALRTGGPATATALAERLGTNSGATSYHLRALADHGFVAEDRNLGTGRERWWRALHEMTSWTAADFLDDPETRAAAEWMQGRQARRSVALIDDWLRRFPEADPSWVKASDSSDYLLHLTPERLESLTKEIHETIAPYRYPALGEEEGAERAVLLLWTFPVDEPLLG